MSWNTLNQVGRQMKSNDVGKTDVKIQTVTSFNTGKGQKVL